MTASNTRTPWWKRPPRHRDGASDARERPAFAGLASVAPDDRLGMENRQRQHGDEDQGDGREQKINRFGGEAGRGALLRVCHSISLQK